MIICSGNKIHDLDYDVIRHWIHLKCGGTQFILSGLTYLDDFYWMVTFTCDPEHDFLFKVTWYFRLIFVCKLVLLGGTTFKLDT